MKPNSVQVWEPSVEHFEKWCRSLILDNGEKVRLEPFQLAFVEDVFAGYRVNWLVLPEGNGKTTLLAALGLYGLLFAPDASIPVAASSRDQARIMYRQMRGFVIRSGLGSREGGEWLEHFDSRFQVHRRRQRPPSSQGRESRLGDTIGLIEVHAADAGTADGVIPFPFAFIDELHRHKDLALHRTWRGKLGKRGAQLVVISTAGDPGGDFEITREKTKAEATAVQNGDAFGRYATERVVLHDWSVKGDIFDLDAVKAANPLKSITKKTLQEKIEDPMMTERHWRRFTCNLATMDEGQEPFIDLQDWDELEHAEIPAGEAVTLGADGSRTWDTTVVAWAAADADGFVTVDARVFSVRDDVGCHVKHEGGKIDFDDVEGFTIDRFSQFRVRGVAYDPRYLERSMEIVNSRVSAANVQAVEPSSKAMREALQAMFNVAAEGKLRHSHDEVLREHVANTGVERGFGSEIRRARKVDSRLPIDAVPAMALAIWMALKNPASVYETRGVVFV